MKYIIRISSFLFLAIVAFKSNGQCISVKPGNCGAYITRVKIIGSQNNLQTGCSGSSFANYNFTDSLVQYNSYLVEVYTNVNIQVGVWLDKNNDNYYDQNENAELLSSSNLADSLNPVVFRIYSASSISLNMLVRCYSDITVHTSGCFQYDNGESEIYRLPFKPQTSTANLKYITPLISFNSITCNRLCAVSNTYFSGGGMHWYYSDDSLTWQLLPPLSVSNGSFILDYASQKKYYKFILHTYTDTINSPVYRVDKSLFPCLCKNAPLNSGNISIGKLSINNNSVYNGNSFFNSFRDIGNYTFQNFGKGNSNILNCEITTVTNTVKTSYLYYLIDKNKDNLFTDDELVCSYSVDSLYSVNGNYNLYFKTDDSASTGWTKTELLISEYPVKTFCGSYLSGQTLLFAINIIERDSLCNNLNAGRITPEADMVYLKEKFRIKLVEYNLVRNCTVVWYKSPDGLNFIPLSNVHSTEINDSITSTVYYKVRLFCGMDSVETAIYKLNPYQRYCLPNSINRNNNGFSFISISNLVYGKYEHVVDLTPVFFGCLTLKDTAEITKNHKYLLYTKYGFLRNDLFHGIIVHNFILCYIDKNRNGVFEPSEMVLKKINFYTADMYESLSFDSTYSDGYYTMRLVTMQIVDSILNPCKTAFFAQSVDFIVNVKGDNYEKMKSKFLLYSNDMELCRGQYPRVSISNAKTIPGQRFYWEFSKDNIHFYAHEKCTIEPFVLFQFDSNVYVRCIIKNDSYFDTSETIYFKRRYFFDCFGMASGVQEQLNYHLRLDTFQIAGISILYKGVLINSSYVDLTKDSIWQIKTEDKIPLKIIRYIPDPEATTMQFYLDQNHDGVFDSTELIKEVELYSDYNKHRVFDTLIIGKNTLPGVTKMRIVYQAFDLRSVTAYGVSRRATVYDFRVDIVTSQNCLNVKPVIMAESDSQCITKPFIIRVINNNSFDKKYIWYQSSNGNTWKNMNTSTSELLTYITSPTYFVLFTLCGIDTQRSNVIKVNLRDPDKCGPSFINRYYDYIQTYSPLVSVVAGTSDLGVYTTSYFPTSGQYGKAYKLLNILSNPSKYDYNYFRNTNNILRAAKSGNTNVSFSHLHPNSGTAQSLFVAVLIDSDGNNYFESNELVNISKLDYLATTNSRSASFNFNSLSMKAGQKMTIRFITASDSSDMLNPRKLYKDNTIYDFTIIFFDNNYYFDKLRIIDTRDRTGGASSISLERTSKNGVNMYYLERKDPGTENWIVADSSDIPTFSFFGTNNLNYRISYKQSGIFHFTNAYCNTTSFYTGSMDALPGFINKTDLFFHINDLYVKYPEEFSKSIPTLPNQLVLRKGTDNFLANFSGISDLIPSFIYKDTTFSIYDNQVTQKIPFITDLNSNRFRIPDYIKSGSYNYVINNSDFKENGFQYYRTQKAYDVLILDALPCSDSLNPEIALDKKRYCKNAAFVSTLKNYEYCDKANYQWFYSFDKNSWVAFPSSNNPYYKGTFDTNIFLKCRISYNNKSKDVITDQAVKFENYDSTCRCQSFSRDNYSFSSGPNIADFYSFSVSQPYGKKIYQNKFFSGGSVGIGGNNYRDFTFLLPAKVSKKAFTINSNVMTSGSGGYDYLVYFGIDKNSNYTFESNESYFINKLSGNSTLTLYGVSLNYPADSNISSGKKILRLKMSSNNQDVCEPPYLTGETQDYWLDIRNNRDLALSPDSSLQKVLHLCSGPKLLKLKVNVLNYGIDTLNLFSDSVKIFGAYFRNSVKLFDIDTFITGILWKSDSIILLDLNRTIPFNSLTKDSLSLMLRYPYDQDTANNFIRKMIAVDSTFIVNLGADKIKCRTDIVSLKSNISGTKNKYLWNTGQTSAEIFVFEEGMYALSIINEEGCQSTDTILVKNSDLPIRLIPSDTTTCNSLTLTINLPIIPGTTYLWENGDTSSIRNFKVNGVYRLKIMNNSGCFVINSMKVTLDSIKEAIPQKNISVCGFEYTVPIVNFNPDYHYFWSDGSSVANAVFNTSGKYFLRIMNAGGCERMDSLNLQLTVPPKPIFTDTTRFWGDTLKLTAAISTSYLWNSGDTTQIKTITQNGKYSVKLFSTSNCYSKDSTYVKFLKKIPIKLGGTKYICDNGYFKVDYLPANLSYLWNDGFKSGVYYISITGFYWFTASDAYGNIYISDTLTVLRQPKPNCDFTTVHLGGLLYGFYSTDSTNDSCFWTINLKTYSGKNVAVTFPSSSNYYISLTSRKNGCSNTCSQNINVKSGIGLNEQKEFNFYPNPTTNLIYFKGNFEEFTNIKVFDSKGVLLFNSDHYSLKTPLNLSNYASGIFIIMVNNSTSIKVIKM